MADPEVPLSRAALVLAALDHAGRPLSRYEEHLDVLAADVAIRVTDPEAPIDTCAEVLSQVLADEYGYTGDQVTYDNLANANLMDVIDRRKGMPIALGILYIHAARAQGWTCNGLSLPGHFLIELSRGEHRTVLDPFGNGRMLAMHDLQQLIQRLGGVSGRAAAHVLAPADNRAILIRLQNNIVERLLRAKSYENAARVIERMVMLSPGESRLWYQLGTVLAKSGNLGAAMRALEQCLMQKPGGGIERDAALALHQLKRSLN